MRELGVNSSGLDVNGNCEIHDGFLSPALPILNLIIFFFGLVSNTMTIFVFFLRKHSDSSMAVYMRHLAIADFLLVLCLPLRVYYHNSQSPFYLCKVLGIFFYVNMYASILFLSLISLDRYLKIIKPVWVLRFHWVRWSHRASFLVCEGLILGMSLFFLRKTGSADRICFHFHHKGLLGGVANLTVVAFFCATFLLFLCFYARITTKLRTMSLGNRDPKAQRRKSRVVWKTFVVPVIFTLCFLPYHLVRVTYVLAKMDLIQALDSKKILHILNELTLLLSALNSCLDPIIYYFLSCTYRRTILCALQGQLKTMYAVNCRCISINQPITEI
ncbi:probable G-protein coupled receptor 34 [Coregonus clupeaformis]|uniref:probable G-protein coupled receptor 34 n=1 Tax=Coregonus clupeaformis TaxID=59861 RepID=UPI001E1C768C|nr:probable G-protein coupled receptor 34 [Coregonus clupeaformis]